jgi:hypothetical protein
MLNNVKFTANIFRILMCLTLWCGTFDILLGQFELVILYVSCPPCYGVNVRVCVENRVFGECNCCSLAIFFFSWACSSGLEFEINMIIDF